MSMQTFIQIGPMLRVHRGIFTYICSNHYIQIFEHGSLLTHFPSLPQLAIRGTAAIIVNIESLKTFFKLRIYKILILHQMKSECLSYFFQLEHEHLIERKLETIVPDSKEKLEDYERT